MKQHIILITLLSFIFIQLSSAQTTTISGYVLDSTSNEALAGAYIYSDSLGVGTTSNYYGFYSITVPSKTLNLRTSYVGYIPKPYTLHLENDTTINFYLNPANNDLNTIEVTSKNYQKIEESTNSGQIVIPIEQIKTMPALLGEADVLKSLQLLPGVQSGNEGTGGLYVRGGSPDQNLILLDGAVVYNANHLFGFFSTFNADAIKNVTLTKGGFPARYGGRLSSILDINMKEGDAQTLKGEGSIGTIFSKVTIEGPIQKGKTSFLLSGRRTYIDAIFGPFLRLVANQDDLSANPNAYFYDFNAKINHRVNDNNQIFLSYYNGKDDFGLKVSPKDEDSFAKFGLNWGNSTGVFRWNRTISNKLFGHTSLIYSKYQLTNAFEFEQISQSDTSSSSSAYISGIEDVGIKLEFDFIPTPKHYIKYGFQSTFHTFSPGITQSSTLFEGTFSDTTVGNDIIRGLESNLYVEDDIIINDALKINIGAHLSNYIVNSKIYTSPQPRIAMRYLFLNDYALKASFSRMTQFLHLLSNEGIGLPTDLWVPTTNNILPQNSWQSTIGIAKTINQNIELSIEGYYKTMDNLLSYKEGASFNNNLGSNTNSNWENQVTQGKGNSFGIELFLQKKVGKTTGWIGYTWSKTTRLFDEINNGQPFPFKYDRRHDFSFVGMHKFNKNINLSVTWVYGTGNAITLPTSKHQPLNYTNFQFSEQIVPTDFDVERPSEKNNYRMRPYHRLDFSLSFKKHKKKFNNLVDWERSWVFGAYNTYGRANPFFIARDFDSNTNIQSLREYSLFPIIPFISYQFKF